MLKLRNILLHNTVFIILFLICILITFFRIINEPNRMEKDIVKPVTSAITTYSIDGNKLTLTMKKYNLIGYYYIESFKEKKYLEKNLNVGDIFKISGDVLLPKLPTTRGLFNYRKYLKTKKIYYTIKITSLKKVKSTSNPLAILKNFVIKRIKKNPYLYTLILGDKSYLSTDAISSYQENGISHLFAISGMHITLMSGIILKILKKIKIRENIRYLITSIILFIYLLLVGFSPSILRGVLFFYLFTINRLFYFYIKNINLFLIALSLTLLINPFYIYDIGFLFSYTISLGLLLSNNFLNSKNYFVSLIKVSYLSMICSIPISLYHYSSINIMSILYNLIFVPLISLIIFPMSLLVIIAPILIKPYELITTALEEFSIFLAKFRIGKLIFVRLHLAYYFILLIVIFVLIILQNRNRKTYLLFIVPVLVIHYFIPFMDNETYIKMIDIGQGDCILLHSKDENILIDTGGNMSYKKFKWQKSIREPSLANSTIIPLLKQLGIRKINYLILTHGDYDHLGEAINLIKYFNIENVVINCNNINYLEEQIIEKANNTLVGKEGLMLKVGDIKLMQLNEDLIDENDSSQIYFADYNNIRMLLTGDASIKSERNLLEKYDLGQVDILKIGHHGSKTSTSQLLLSKIKPKVALISVGKDNKFNHPNKEIVDRLNNNKISYFRTDISGTITIDLKKLTIVVDNNDT